MSRDIHFRVSETMYGRIREEAEHDGVSVAHFAREATLVRAVVYANRRGARWANGGSWEELVEAIDRIDSADAKLRARSARERRQGRG